MRGHRLVLLMLSSLASLVGAQTDPTPQPTATPTPTPTPMATASPAASATTAFPASSSGSPVPSRKLVDELSPSQLQQILSEIQSRYVDQRALTLTIQELGETSVPGLVSRLAPGIILEPQAAATVPLKPSRPFRKEIVFGQFGYVRLGDINPEAVAKLDDALKEFQAHNATGVVLDLRTVPPGYDYAQTVEIAGRFTRKNTEVFRLLHAKTREPSTFTTTSEPLFTGPLAVLINGGVAGAGEALAAALKRYAHALLVGERTAGQAVQYDCVLVGRDLILKVAVAEVEMPGAPDLFPKGLAPDLEVKLSPADQDTILTATDTGSVLPFVVEEERPRTNEAALVAGKNPDLDAYEQQQANKGKPAKPKDGPLQRALDFLITVAFYHVNQ